MAQRVVQGPQIPPGGRGHADAAVEALHVGDLFQAGNQLFPQRGRLQQLLHRVQPLPDRLQPHQRIAEPLFQAACPHGGRGTVQAPQQRAALLPLGHGGGDLQVAAGGRVQGQVFAALVDPDVADMGYGGLSVLPQVIEGSAGRHQAVGHGIQPQCLGRGCAELAAEKPGGVVPFIDPARRAGNDPLPQKGTQVNGQGCHVQPIRQQHLAWVDAGRLTGCRRSAAQFRDPELAGGKVEPGDAPALRRTGRKGQQIVVLVRGEALRLDQQAGGDHLDHFAPHDPLGLLRVLHLLADGHLVAGLDQPGDVRGGGVKRDAAEGDVVPAPPGARGQGNIQDAGSEQRVVQKHLVKVAHAEEEDRIGIARFDLQILPHHGGLFCHCV